MSLSSAADIRYLLSKNYKELIVPSWDPDPINEPKSFFLVTSNNRITSSNPPKATIFLFPSIALIEEELAMS